MKKMMMLGLLAGALNLNALQAQRENRERPTEAQRQERAEKQEQHKASINLAAGFTAQEAEAFWSLQRQMREELRGIKSERPERKTVAESTDEELSQRMEQRFQMEEQKLSIRRKYHASMVKAVGIRKLALAMEAQKKHHDKD